MKCEVAQYLPDAPTGSDGEATDAVVDEGEEISLRTFKALLSADTVLRAG